MIKRTITSTTISYQIITSTPDGELSAANLTTVMKGAVSRKKANTHLQKLHPGKTFLITSIDTTSKMYAISAEDFIKYGTEVAKD